MTQAAGDTPLLDPTNLNKGEQQSPAPTFPNTRWMNPTIDLSRNPGIFDDTFKKIKGMLNVFIENSFDHVINCRFDATSVRRCEIIGDENSQ